MRSDDLKPAVTIRGSILSEPVQVIVSVPLGAGIKLISKGLKSGKVHELVSSFDQIAFL